VNPTSGLRWKTWGPFSGLVMRVIRRSSHHCISRTADHLELERLPTGSSSIFAGHEGRNQRSAFVKGPRLNLNRYSQTLGGCPISPIPGDRVRVCNPNTSRTPDTSYIYCFLTVGGGASGANSTCLPEVIHALGKEPEPCCVAGLVVSNNSSNCFAIKPRHLRSL
jgi:hypothetical protein